MNMWKSLSKLNISSDVLEQIKLSILDKSKHNRRRSSHTNKH
jgi:hypothetical protein